MELDDFKNIFREKTQTNSSKSKEEIEVLRHKKSTSALEKIMRNMVVEIAISFVVCIALAIALLSIKPAGIPLLLAVLTMAAVSIQVAFFYPSFQKFRQLHKSGSENLIIWLNELIETLENFIKAYRRYIAWGIPLGGLLGASTQLIDTNREIPVPTIDFEPNVPAVLSILILLGFTVVLFGATYWLAYYTVKKLYSRYLDELNASKKELMREN